MLFKPLFLSFLFTGSLAAVLFHQGPSEGVLVEEKCDKGRPCECHGCNIAWDENLSKEYICGDKRLGPTKLPTGLPLGTYVAGYDRFGNKSPNDFLGEWWNNATNNWRYPKLNGFGLDEDGIPMKANVELEVGTLVDRFGNDSGRFMSPATAPFSQRALNPQNLNTDGDEKFPNNYHVYNVTQKFTVVAGPIKPWFGQPGFGVQFFLGIGIKVQDHIKMGNLKVVDPSKLPKQASPVCHGGDGAAGEEL